MAACALIGLSCASTDKEPPTVLLVVIDTLRGDRLGCTGYEQASTPVLDSLAAQGVLFRDAMTPVPVTLPAISSLLTGRLPFHHGVRDNDRFVLPPEEVTLAERLRDKGYDTRAVVASAVISSDRGVDQGFAVYDDNFAPPYAVYSPTQEPLAEVFAETRRRADTVTDRAVALARSADPDRALFLMAHYFDVHMHYDPPPAYAAEHPGNPYDGEVSFVDHEVGRLIQGLKHRKNLVVMVVSDHGEAQNEHGEPQHGFLLYQSTLHVPVIVSGPGIPRGLERRDPVSLVDLEPTLAAYLGLDPVGDRDGRVLSWEKESPAAPLYAETLRPLISYDWSPLRTIRYADLKFIDGPPSELFNVPRDPGELVALDNQGESRRLGGILAELIQGDDAEAVHARSRGLADPERREMLESLGYIGGSSGGDEGVARPHPKTELPGWLRFQESKELFRAAATLLQEGRAAESIPFLDSVIVLNQDLGGAYYLRGTAHELMGNVSEAQDDFRMAAVFDEDPSVLWSARASLAEISGEKKEAFECWSRAFEADADNTGALEYLAQWYLNHDEPREALPFLRRLVDIVPDSPEARYNLGVSAARTDRAGEAKRHFRVYLQLQPDTEQAEQVREWMGHR